MKLIEIIYILSTLTAVVASLPQILQLLRTKASDELSISTWSLWLATQVITLSYMISTHNKLLIVVSSVWLVFYVVMLGLIFRYRQPSSRQIPEYATSSDTSDEQLA